MILKGVLALQVRMKFYHREIVAFAFQLRDQKKLWLSANEKNR